MPFAGRIALLARDALLSRRRAVPVELSGAVAHRASLRRGHVATAPSNPICRRRIEFNKAVKRTPTRGEHIVCRPEGRRQCPRPVRPKGQNVGSAYRWR